MSTLKKCHLVIGTGVPTAVRSPKLGNVGYLAQNFAGYRQPQLNTRLTQVHDLTVARFTTTVNLGNKVGITYRDIRPSKRRRYEGQLLHCTN